jgi:peptidoglycan hydrolase-like protein with peptidoglycan-binding domain
VGFSDQPRVQILSAQTLETLVTPDTRGLGVGDLSAVAWSRDGARLFAGGRYQTRAGNFPVIVWEQGGAGKRNMWSGSASNILDLRALPQGGLIASTSKPEWRRYTANGAIETAKSTVIPDQRDKLGDHFRVSADGRQVSFGLGYGGEDPVLFDLDAKRVFEGNINETWLLQSRLNALGYNPGGIDGLMGPATNRALQAWRADQGLGAGRLDDPARARLNISPLQPARIRAPGLEVKNWKNSTQPLLDNHPLRLSQYEPARALAVAPDGNSFLLGTGYNLRRLDAEGREIWSKSVADTAWGVNITADGQLALAALGDGTLRWYRYRDGQELLALFVHKGTRDWVIWTPRGYYDTSPGGDRLIGWHLNRFERGGGLLLLGVMDGSPAQAAGLKAGDVIESINGATMTRREDLVAALPQGSADNPLTFNLFRDDQYVSVKVVPGRNEPGGPPTLGAYIGERLASASAADFYPVANFRDRFYRPDIVTATLANRDEAAGIASARGRHTGAEERSVAQTLPPMVQILSPTDGASFTQGTTYLRYRVRNTAQDDLQGVRILVDGRPLDTARGLQRVKPKPIPADNTELAADETIFTTEIELPQRDIELTLIAENQFGASPAETVTLTWAGEQSADQALKPKLYALVAGVSDYDDDRLDLAFAAKDAEDFTQALQRQKGGIYRDIEVRTLTDPDADSFLDGLDWLRAKVTREDVAILFASGHGVNDRDGDYFYLTRDVDTDRLTRTAISQYEIQKVLASLPGKVLAFVDTCHSGNVMGARPGVADVTAVVNDLAAAEHGIVVFASSSAKQLSLENAEWGNGAFTKALVEGMDGRRDYEQDGQITVHELQLYLSHRVKELTHNRQTPTTTIPQTITDFPVAITPGMALTAGIF